jgi:SRSO17 transposase
MTFNVKVALINQKQNYKTNNNLLKNEHKHPKRILLTKELIIERQISNTSMFTNGKSMKWWLLP